MIKVNKEVLKIVKEAIKRGKRTPQIRLDLLNQGYNSKEIEEAIQLAQTPAAGLMKHPWLIILSFVLAVVIVVSILSVRDVVEPVEEEYVEEEILDEVECVNDDDCEINEQCIENKCEILECGVCEITEEHECVILDCDDNDECTEDECVGGECVYGEIDACKTEEIKEATNVTVPCISGDNICPSRCTILNDGDCRSKCVKNIDCGDNKTSTEDRCNPITRKCENKAITSCRNNDNYCPNNCDAGNDNDCIFCSKNEDCDDNKIETEDICNINTGVCSNEAITECKNDGYCPAGCTSLNDDDCPVICGNSVVEGGEKCDNNCPAECNDNNPCTSDALSGKADECSAECSYEFITICQNDDQCCPSGCSIGNDNDCS